MCWVFSASGLFRMASSGAKWWCGGVACGSVSGILRW